MCKLGSCRSVRLAGAADVCWWAGHPVSGGQGGAGRSGRSGNEGDFPGRKPRIAAPLCVVRQIGNLTFNTHKAKLGGCETS